MRNSRTTDVIVRYDQASHNISMSALDGDEASRQPSPFSLLNVADFNGSLELANEVGMALIAFLDATHPGSFISSAELASIEPRDSEETPFERARMLIGSLGDSSTEDDLRMIDSLLEAASADGDEKAAAYLRARWPPLRDVFVRRISRQR